MSKEIAPGLHWLYESGSDRSQRFGLDDRMPGWYDPDQAVFVSRCAYLVDGGESSLLFDTLSPAGTEQVLAEIDECVDELDYLVVSHPDVPHAGNAMAILEEHPEAELVAPAYGNDHELYHLGDATKVGEGDAIDLGDRVVEFHEATFPDAPVSVWMTERTTGTLFPVDWMGFPHHADERHRFADEMATELDVERLVEFHGRVLFWYQYVDPTKMETTVEGLIEKFDPEMIAPAHGLVIRERPVEYMRMMNEVAAEIDRQGRVGILG